MELELIKVRGNYLRYLSICPDYPVVHLQLPMISNPTVWSGIRPDNPVLRHATYTDWSRLDGRVGVCVMALNKNSFWPILASFQAYFGRIIS